MKRYPDKYFDLAIVDPPYGIGDKFKGGKTGKMNFNEIVNKDWDKVPSDEYFAELQRVSKNQIVWGGNYFNLPPTRCFIVWDKIISEDFSLAMAELAWTSFDKLAKIYKLQVPKNGKIHPTQKPVKLYEWLLMNYAKEGDKILDTHLGSGSIAIACHNLGFDLVACELDAEYYKNALKRLQQHQAQLTMF
jgi:site-specific DNA-methyltransferase (adenine-specific)